MAKEQSRRKSPVSERFTSQLESGQERFLAHALEFALESKWRTAQDFIRHFPPLAIMEALSEHAELRAKILVKTTGIKQGIAEKKSWQSAGEDVQIALDSGETTADGLVRLFEPDDRVRYLGARNVWQFLTESDIWSTPSSDPAKYQLAKDCVAFVMERALADGLVTHREVVEGITLEELTNALPKSELGKAIEAAITRGHSDTPFTEVDLLGQVPPFMIVEYVALPRIWSGILEPMAKRQGYAGTAEEPEKGDESSTPTNRPPPSDKASKPAPEEGVVSEDDFITF